MYVWFKRDDAKDYLTPMILEKEVHVIFLDLQALKDGSGYAEAYPLLF